eukprot:m.143028 g.143028  ORF g.143028 m.143028 type:complete len:494 (+) comp16729_c1_seq2:350-1831(+)
MEGFHDAGLGFTVPLCYVKTVPVGRGAFGLVAKAEVIPGMTRPQNAYFGRLATHKVAIKKIGSATAYKDSYHAKQVYREISLLKQLTHENIIKLVDLFVSPAQDLYIVTEAMECDLASFVNNLALDLTENHIRYLTTQILRGLKYMHSAGVLHRDLKPQNILINSNLEARICDLGLARVSAPRDGLSTGYVTTRWYRAPEVMLTWQHYTNALDMWSVGCILAEMLNRLNKRATFIDAKTRLHYYAIFPADSHAEHLRMILETLGPPPPQVVTAINEASIREFVLEMMRETYDPHNTRTLLAKLSPVSPVAVDLVNKLLHYDPALRISAADALAHPFLAPFRDLDEEYTRSPISTAFEGLELPVEMWQTMIMQEVNTLAVVDEGELQVPPQTPQQDFDQFSDLLSPTSGMQDLLPMAGDDGLEDQMNTRLNRAVEQIQSERAQLMQLASRPDLEPPQRAQLMHAVGEVSTRLELYKQGLTDRKPLEPAGPFPSQ